MASRTPDKRWTGIHRHGNSWRAVVSLGRNRPPVKRVFQLDTDPREMQEWRADERAKHRLERKRRATKGEFAKDARAYLASVKAMPTYKERVREIELWIDAFGKTRRDEMTPAVIRRWRDHWLTESRGINPKTGKELPPLSAGTVNKRLRALSNLFRVLDGKQAYNPVRDVEEAREPEATPRALDYPTIERIIGEMRDYAGGQWTRREPPKDWAPAAPALAKVRVRLLAYTGLSPSTLKRLAADDVDLERQLVRLPPRRKGRGVAGAWIPLLPPAIDAFRDLDRLDGWGPFSLRSVRHAFRRAAIRAGVPKVRLHDLRHSLGTLAFDLTGSIDVVMALLQHASPATTKRYTLAAALRVLQQKTQPLADHLRRTTPVGQREPGS